MAEKKKGEKERRSSQKKKKEKEKKSGSTTKDVGSRVKKEKERDISHPPAVKVRESFCVLLFILISIPFKTIIDRLVTLPASDDHQVSEATVSSLKVVNSVSYIYIYALSKNPFSPLTRLSLLKNVLLLSRLYNRYNAFFFILNPSPSPFTLADGRGACSLCNHPESRHRSGRGGARCCALGVLLWRR